MITLLPALVLGATLAASPQPCTPASLDRLAELQVNVNNDTALVDRLQQLEDAYKTRHPPTDAQLRQYATEAASSLSVAAQSFEDAIRRFTYPPNGPSPRIWGERTGALQRSGAQLRGSIGTLSGPPANFTAVSKVAAEYQDIVRTLTEDLIALRDNTANAVLTSALDAAARRVNLTGAALAGAAAFVAANDVGAVGLRLRNARALLGAETGALNAARAACPNAPQPREATESQRQTKPKPHMSAGKLLLISGLAAGGASAGIFAAVSAANKPVTNFCSSSQSQAIVAVQREASICANASTNPIIVQCNLAQKDAIDAVNAYCSCLGQVSTATNSTTFDQEILRLQNGGACR